MRIFSIGTATLGAALLSTGSLLPVAVSAQEAIQVEEIVVTGSNIRRNRDYDTPSPIQTIGLEEIDAAGAGQVQDVLRTLSVNAGSELSTSQNGRQGVAQFSLRGLGVSGTLTLINGRRAGVSPIASDDGFFFTDINQYPVNMIERIEVLTDGASATYGSEAVGGVVNLITRNNFEGAEFGVEARSATNDAYSINAAFGSSFERGHFATFMNFYKQDGNFRGEFDWLRARDNNGNQLATASRWDSGTGAGRYNLAVDPDGDGVFARSGGTVADPLCGSPNSVGVVNTFVSGSNCRYSFIDQRRLIPEESRFQVFTTFNYDLTDSVNFFSELSFSSNEIRDGIGGAVLRTTTDNGGFLIPSAHPFNYFVSDGAGGVVWDEAAVAADPTQAVDVIFRGRPLTTFDGELADDITRKYDSTRGVFGINADINENWNLNASYMYARTQFSDRQPRSYNADAFRAAIGSGDWNPFGIAWANPAATSVKDNFSVSGNTATDLGLFSTNRVFQSEAVQQVAEVIISGDLMEMPSGVPVSVAIGAQYRDFGYNDIADSLSVFRLDGRADPVFSIDDANQDVYAIFAEALIPATESIEIQLALRYEDYGTGEGGDTTDPKIGVQWQVTDELMVRGSWGTSFQAPSIRNVAGAVGSGALEDRATGLNVGDPCAATPDSFNAAQITTGGDLSPQSATNYNLGLVYQSGNFTGSLDFFNYEYEDLIQTGDDFQSILDGECVSGVYAPDSRVIRDPSGQLNSVTSSFVNVGQVDAQGFDMNLNYVFEDVLGGELQLDGVATYVTTFDIDQDGSGVIFDGANNRNRFIGFGSLPDLRANLALTWRTDRHSAGLTGRYISAYDDRTPTAGSTGIDSQTVWDLQYGINLDGLAGSGSTNLTIGINNILDEDPPEVAVDRIAYDGQVHDPRGRIVYVRAKHNF